MPRGALCALRQRCPNSQSDIPPTKKKTTGGKQSSLAGTGMYPMLSKTGVAIGLFSLVPGGFWVGCGTSMDLNDAGLDLASAPAAE